MKRRNFVLSSLAVTLGVLPFSGLFAKNNRKGVFMISHPSDTRGVANHGWLNSRHTFSFAEYYNPSRMGFGALRVINDDSVDAGMGFGTHPHRDMEIISIPLEGSLKHKDSEGNEAVIRKGEVQIMSAGTGIAHSEKNNSDDETVKFLQIWVMPEKMGIKPRYEQKAFPENERKNRLAVVVSPDGRDGSVSINQQAFFSLANLDQGKTVEYKQLRQGNGVYIFVIKGSINVEGQTLNLRDGLAVEKFETLKLAAAQDSEILLMEVPV
jgi:redox-sensitive bicupin YhaK (pirin superfamily)